MSLNGVISSKSLRKIGSVDSIIKRGMLEEYTMNKKQDVRATLILVVCDGGQHGSKSCSACGCDVPEDVYDNCPKCGAKFVGVELGPTFGGSDF